MVKKSKQIFGLLGRNIEYSFSRAYFNEKFFSLGLSNYSYQNFDLQNLTNVSEIFNKKNVKGLNVTGQTNLSNNAIRDECSDMEFVKCFTVKRFPSLNFYPE